jgi:hypothetical protein
MDFRHLIVTCLFSMLRLSFETQKIKENYAIFIFKRPRFVNAILVRLACHFPPSFSDKADYFLFL